ncbi:YiiD C-terminal domain-containing protein [Halomonas sp. PAMB 3264]|uniref:YiiD C-terminal domain-containing protein n=1 Tax=Halomonas sp. PAMB 3264 TaxID=3075222 RepID=UPI0028979635|nr:YiiD C-terminal domain-containing protein [Halomonas sp. PAMB 3264]WNL41264.1 YiiD C-terminal domain-containing protein [Halomonas sp. PAMB 3264]
MATSREPGTPFPRLSLPEKGEEDLDAFQRWLTQAIPMVDALGLKRMSQNNGHLVWELALAPSLNDKGTGFGGALTAQTTLLGWCWTTLWLRQQGLARDVVVADASQRFLAPVTHDYRLICKPEDPRGPDDLASRLETRGKGRITLVQALYCHDVLCLEARGTYAVLS